MPNWGVSFKWGPPIQLNQGVFADNPVGIAPSTCPKRNKLSLAMNWGHGFTSLRNGPRASKSWLGLLSGFGFTITIASKILQVHASNRKWLITHPSNRVYPTYIWVIRWLSPPIPSHLWQKLATLGQLLTQAALIPKRCLSRIARNWIWEVTVYAFNGAKQRYVYESKSWQLSEQPKCW